MTVYTPEERRLIDQITRAIPEDVKNAARRASNEYKCYFDQLRSEHPQAFENPNNRTLPLYEMPELSQEERDKLKRLNQASNSTYSALTDAAREVARTLGVDQERVRNNEYLNLHDISALDVVRGAPQCNLISDASKVNPSFATVASSTAQRRGPTMSM